MAASCAMACQWSTAAMIGQALAVPVLVFDFHQSPSANVWAGVDGLHHAQSIEQFDALLRHCLHSAATRRQFLSGQRRFVDHYLRLDGKARERIAALIRQQARQGLEAADRKTARSERQDPRQTLNSTPDSRLPTPDCQP